MKRFRPVNGGLTVGLCLTALFVLAAASRGGGSVSRPAVAPAGQTSTLLPDGRWLFIGGNSPTGPLAAAMVWDPQTGGLTPTRQAPQFARAGHTATVLPDGTVLLLGGIGHGGAVVTTAEMFLPDTQHFTPLLTPTLTPRAFHSATLLTDGRVLLAGGRTSTDEVLPTAELWDPRTLTSGVASGVMRMVREQHGAELLPDGTVRLSRGRDAEGHPVTDDERYNPATETFTPGSEPLIGTAEAPTVVMASLPESGATGVALEALLSVRFSQPVQGETATPATVVLAGPRGAEDALVAAAEGGRLVFVTPTASLAPATVYTLRLDGVADANGTGLPRTELSFTTTAESLPTLQFDGEITAHPERRREAPKSKDTLPASEVEGRVNQDANNNYTPAKARDVSLLYAPPGVTALSGRVLRLNGRPLAHVTLEVEGHRTQTDAQGRFLLTDLPAGHHELLIDGRSANRLHTTFGVFEVGVEILGGTTTVLPYTIWMPKLDMAHAVTIPSPTTGEVVITNPRLPGLEFHLPPGTVITDHKGNVVTQVSITPIPLDKPPHPLPVNVDVPVYFTIQPGGAYIKGSYKDRSKGGWLVYPNTVGEAPGARFSFWRYDPEGIGWGVYGLGTVTPDGHQIVPDREVRIYEFTGAMINGGGAPDPEPNPKPCPTCHDDDGEPVDLGTGIFTLEQTDLVLPGTPSLALTRVYKAGTSNNRPFGIGTTHLYEMFLWSARQYQEVDLILPDGGRIHYVRTSPGTAYNTAVFEHTETQSAFYKSKIVSNGKSGWDLTLKDGTVYVFGENAPLQSIRDRYGNVLMLTRENVVNLYGIQTGNILQVTASNGRWIAFTYNAQDRITQARDNLGRTVNYTYDASGRLWKVTDPNGGVKEFTYDANHRMLTRKDEKGTVVLTNEYTAQGRVSRQTLSDGGVYQFAYTTDSNGKITQVDLTNPRGHVRRVAYGTNGLPVSDTHALGTPEQQTTTFTRQAGTNLLLSMTDPLGRRTDYAYDAMGNMTSKTYLAGTPNAVTTTWTYEPTFHHVASVTNPLGHTTSYTYDVKGSLTTIIDPLNHQTTFTYNTAGQPLTVTTALGHTTQMAYTFSDLVTVTDPLGNVTKRKVDAAGRLFSLTNPLGQQVHYSYDALNRVTQATDPLGNVTAFTYDANDNLLTLTDARNGVTTYTYDSLNQVATRKDPLLRTESSQYDLLGNRTQFTDRKAQATSFTYDPLNRLKQVTYADGSTKTYTYDAGNRLTQVVDSLNGTISWTYDGLDRVLSETTAQGVVNYTYDAAGRRTSMTVQGQPTVNYTYDNANRLTQITQGASTATFTYDNANRRTSLTLPNGVLIEYSYDNASRLTGLLYKKGAVTLGDLTYTYDKAGRRTISGGTYARTGIPSAITTATYDAANQQLILGNKSATFDANGNLATLTDPAGTTTYTWNVRDQLASISGPGLSSSFQYDALGRRKQKTVNGATTAFLYDDVTTVQELSSGSVQANLLTGMGIDEVLQRTDTVATRSFLADGLGSTLALTDNAGTVQTEYTYEPFGATTINGLSSANPSQYTGRENDSTGLYYYRARYYHPVLQRFISQDPIGFASEDFTLYAYVGNNPLNWIDPFGWGPKDRWYGHNEKDFQKWVHRKMKDNRPVDFDEGELDDLKQQWEDEGRPGPDKKGKYGHKKDRGNKGKGFLPGMTTVDAYCKNNPLDCKEMFDQLGKPGGGEEGGRGYE